MRPGPEPVRVKISRRWRGGGDTASARKRARSRGPAPRRRRGRGAATARSGGAAAVVDDAPREDAARVAHGRRLLVVDDGRRVALGGLRRPPGLRPRRRRRGRRLRHRDRARRHGPARDVVRPVRGVLVLRVLVEGRARREEREHGVEVLATLLRRLRRGAEPGVLRHLVVSPRFSGLLGVRAVSPGAARGVRALFFNVWSKPCSLSFFVARR